MTCHRSLTCCLEGVYGLVAVYRGAAARMDKDLLARLQQTVIDVARCQQIDTVIEIKANQIESRFDFISNRVTKAVK